MSDLIDRQAAIDAVSNWLYDGDDKRSVDQLLSELPSAQPEIIRCKDCKYFEYDHFENVGGIPIIVAHEICKRWGNGVKTNENGFCFLADRREDVKK